MTNATEATRKLVRQLQGACSGELAAGFAYRGHANSLPQGLDRDRIREIEAEEWHHRQLVLDLLRQMGEGPSRVREVIFWCIGKVIGFLCHVGGWFIPMYGAGKLERGNITEYEEAAIYAAECGRPDMIDCILMMAEVEWEHERFFRERLIGHSPISDSAAMGSAAAEKHDPRILLAERPEANTRRLMSRSTR